MSTESSHSERRDGLEVREWSAADGPATDAFGLAPGEREALLPLRSAAEWDWAARAGARLVLARREGRVVARAGCVPVRTRVFGEPRTFAWMLDHGLAPGERDPAALLAAARALREARLAPEADLVHYAWPGPRDRELGRAELEEERLRVQSFLVRDVAGAPAGLPPLASELAGFGPEADFLYACCSTHWHASAIRDAAFLRWRFLEHPVRRYRVLGVRVGDVLRGYAVVRAGDELGPRLGLLVDWLVLPGDEEASEALLAAALHCARALGAPALAAAIPEWSPWSEWFQLRGFLHHPSEHVLVVRSAAPRFDMLWLRDNWWTTLADALDL